MRRWKKDGNHSPPKSNLIQDSEGNEENRYPVPDSNKTKVNDAKEWQQEHPQRKNFATNHWEFHRDVTRHGLPKCTSGTQEIAWQQK
jgi:hypothetical protein